MNLPRLTASLLVALALAAILPQPDVARESVDLCEVNHFYDEQGRLVFDQCIFYTWNDDHARFDVVAWRLVKNPSQLPVRDWTGGGYSAVWQDGELMRSVKAKAIRETWTQYDVELVERDILPKEKRAELSAPKVRRAK